MRAGLQNSDDVIGVLADRACREALAHLRDRGETATTVTALACDCRTDEPGGTADVAVRLHHVTLPKLDAYGIVDYVPAEQTVTYRRHDDVETWLDLYEERSSSCLPKQN